MRTRVRYGVKLGFAFCLAVLPIAAAQNDAAAMHQRAIARIDAYRQNYLKTGDLTKLAPELDRAIEELSGAVAQFTNNGDDAGTARSLIKLGEIRRLQNRHAAALDLFKRGFVLAKKSGDAASQALALIGQGRCEMAGPKDTAAAAAHFEEAVAISAALPDRTHHFNALCYVAQTQFVAGNFIGAMDLLNRALAVATGVKDQSLLLYAHLDRADNYIKLGEKCGASGAFTVGMENFGLARADYDAALAIARDRQYAHIAAEIEQFHRSLAVRRQGVEANERLAGSIAKAQIFNPKKASDVHASETFIAPGQPVLPGLFEALQREGVITGDAKSFFIKASLCSLDGKRDEALADCMKAIELLEADRRNLREETSRGTFLEDKITIYYLPIRLLLEQRRFAEAFELMERSRSRAFADLLFSKKLALAQPEEQALYGEAQRLRAEIALLQKKLFDYRTRADRGSFSSEMKSAEEQIERLEKQDRASTAQMAQKAPRLRELIVSPTVPLDRIQQMLRRDGCDMLYYLVLDESVVLWHIGGDSVHVRSVFLPHSELNAKIATLRTSVSDGNAKFNETAARELFLFLIQPAMGWIKSRQLVLIPHAEMHHLPFAALIDPSGKSLGETFALSHAPSAGVLLELKKGEAMAKGRLLAAADPGIEEARGEVEAVAAFYPGRNKTIIEPLIAESEVKASAGDYDVLHFSVHGKFTPLEPMLSSLQLGKDARDDGRLTAAEMFGLPLGKARLVVLSACETGQSEATLGNEILGMERALLYAGANNLVLSAWPVDSASTAFWMKTFHRNAQQTPLAEAARLALIEVKAKYPHPYHWAAFRLVGK